MNRCRKPSLLFALWMGVLLVTAAATDAAPAAKLNRVIVYPGPSDSFDDLKALSQGKVVNQGGYWLARANEDQLTALREKFGGRVQVANYLNVIELAATALDTTAGEPAVPAALRAAPGQEKKQRLMLVQFTGPVLPLWLRQVKQAGNAKVLSYIPNNTYVVRADQAAEKKLQELLQPNGPIQYIGAYHPYYKLSRSLRELGKSATVEVRLAVADGPDAVATLQTIDGLALARTGKPAHTRQQTTLQITVRAADVARLAQLEDVLWVERVLPRKRMDESLDLTCTVTDDGSSAVGYLDWLLGVAGFQSIMSMYPVLDIADSGLDTRHPITQQPTWHPNFWIPDFPVSPTATTGDGLNFFYLPRVVDYADYPVDTDGHGTVVASVACGFESRGNETIDCYREAVTTTCITNRIYCGFDPVFGGVTCLTNLPLPNVEPVLDIKCETTCEPSINEPPTDWPRLVIRGSLYGLGVSPFGRLVPTPGGAEPAFTTPEDHAFLAYTLGARISNNSWGEVLAPGQNDGAYSGLSQSYDSLTRDAIVTGSVTPPTPGPHPVNQEFFYVFAGGNANGIDGVGGYGDVLVTPPATAKNVLSVGASTKVDGIASFTSFGPCEDGRFKPEVVAPGSGIYGAQSQATYDHPLCGGLDPNNPTFPPCEMGFFLTEIVDRLYSAEPCTPLICAFPTPHSGTSFSAPAVAGAAQLLWYWFENRLLMLPPSPAMMRAYIVNSAYYLAVPNPLTGATDRLPSPAQGMGRLDLSRMFDSVPRVIRDQTTGRAIDTPLLSTNPVPQQTFFSRTGQSYELSGTVFDPNKQFRVTLAWADAPGSPAAFKQLVNDLDLEVTINGQTYNGNIFERQYSTVDPSRPTDDINNIESVFLPAGTTGEWSVVVSARNIADSASPNSSTEPNQDWTLVVYNGHNASDRPQAETNDTCQTASSLVFAGTNTTITITNTLTKGVYHNNHPSPSAGRGGIEAFYRINQPPAGTLFGLDAIGSAIEQVVVSVWKGDCGELVEVVSTKDPIAINFVAEGGVNYYIVVEGYRGATGQFVLNVRKTPPTLTIVPATINFSNQVVGVTSAPRTVVVSNTGTTPVDINSVTLSGVNPEDFAIGLNNCTGQTLLPGNSCSITVTFRPTSVLARSAELLIQASDPGSPHKVLLIGTGVAATPQIAWSPDPVLFGEVVVGAVSAPQTVVVTNKGTASLVITDIVLGGLNPGDFQITSQGCLGATVPAGGTCTITLTFVPQDTADRTATVQISSTASATPAIVTLLGTGLQPPSDIAVIPATTSFSNTIVGTSSAAQSVILSNSSAKQVKITNVVLTGANPGDFSLSGNACTGVTLSSNQTCTLQVTFTPTTAGPRAAQLTILHNGSGNPRTAPVTGVGIIPTPAICLPTAAVAFGDQTIGTTSTVKSIIVTNCGSANLLISNIQLGGANAGDFILVSGSCPSVLPGGTCTINVQFAPTALGLRGAAVVIADNVAGSPQAVALTGNSLAPSPLVCGLPASLTFGTETVGVPTAAKSITLTNCGVADLTVASVAITGADAAPFEIVGDTCTGVIPAGGACTISVRFTAPDLAAHAANLVVTDDAPGAPHVVALRGQVSTAQPDALYAKKPKLSKMLGNGLYSADGLNQTFALNIKRGSSKPQSLFVALQNDGTAPDGFTIKGGGSQPGWTVRYFLGSTGGPDITAAIQAGTFSTSTLNPGAVTGDATMLRIEISAIKDDFVVPAGSTDVFTVVATSRANGAKQDVMRVAATAK